MSLPDTLHAEIARLSRLASDRVVWDRQKAPARALPCVELRLEGPSDVGALNGEEREEYDPDAPAGMEIGRSVVSDLEFVLRVQVRHTAHAGARDLALAIRMAFRVPSSVDRLDAEGIVVVECGPVLDVGEVVETGWQGRSAFTVRLRVANVTVDPEWTTYIESAQVDGSTN